MVLNQFKLFVCLLFGSVISFGQNTISIKKNYPTIEAIFKADVRDSKTAKYYCFKKDGYVYGFNSNLNRKKVIKNCSINNWLKQNSIKAQYIYKRDSVLIYPISYSIIGEETTTEFCYFGDIDSTTLHISAIGQPAGNKYKFDLFYPAPLVIEKK